MMRGRVAAALLIAAGEAWAGRPLTVEDADVVEEGGCQLEAWIDRSREATTAWAVPACNFFLNTEVQAGFARSSSSLSDAYVQAKTRVSEVSEEHPWGTAVVVRATRKPLNEVHRGYDNPYVIAVVTRAIGDGPLLVHGNVGWGRDREAARDTTQWGLAAESPVGGSPLAVLGEVFGENSERPFWRLGVRWTAVPKYLDIDLTYLTRSGANPAERFVSLGFTWQTGRLAR